MSCVVGLIQNGKIFLGSDSQATTPDGERRPIKTIKVFRNKKYLIGYTGSVRAGQILQEKYFEAPDDIFELPDAIREHLSTKGTLLVNDEQAQMQNMNLLIAYEGNLYEILADFQLNEVSGSCTAIGTGASYAMGSLHTTNKLMLSPEERVTAALEAACEYEITCGLPTEIQVF